MRIITIRTVNGVIKHLGGPKGMAAILGVSNKAVSKWKERNRFPAETFLVIQEALAKSERRGHLDIWQMTRPKSKRYTLEFS